MTERRRTFLKTVGSVTLAGAVAGCGQEEPEDEETPEPDDQDEPDADEDTPEPAEANLRVAHLSPDAPNVDVFVDGDAVLEDVPFSAFSDYLEVVEGTYAIEITAAGDPDTVVFEEDVELGEGSVTAAALGELADENQPFSVELFEDDLSDPGENARVRAIHASPDAPNVDITVESTGDVLFEDVPFGAAGAVEVPEGAYTLEIRPATPDNDGDVVATFDLELAAGTTYTAAAVGYLAPDDAPADEPFDLLLEVDEGPDDFEPTDDIGFRVGHFSPDAPNVDVFVDGDAVVEGVAYTDVSDYLDVAPGTYDVEIAASDDRETVVFDEELALDGDSTAVAIGELADENQPFSVELLEDDLSDPDDEARVRVLHASPDAPNVDITVESTGDVLFEDVPFGAAGTVGVPGADYTLEVRPATPDNDGDVVADFDVQLEAGGVYTAVAAGYLTPDDAPADEAFDLLVEVDRDPN